MFAFDADTTNHLLSVLLLALLLEYLFADPQTKWHPVALFGRWLTYVEALMWRDNRLSGVLAWLLAVFVGLAIMVIFWRISCMFNAFSGMLFQAVLLWLSLGWKSLITHVQVVAEAPDLLSARQRVAQIVGRQTQTMNTQDVQRATLETLAENTSDSIIAPLFWFALFGVWGAWLYRMVNTLDAMWGYHHTPYQSFGYCAAKIDDVLNWLPARLTAVLMLLPYPALWSCPISAQARQHLSPNAGYPETSMAFLLGIRLGGPVQRITYVEQRAWFGVTETILSASHIQQGIRITHQTVLLMLLLIVGCFWLI